MNKKIKNKKQDINKKHIKLYDEILIILEFLISEFSHELKCSELDFIDLPKNTVATLDFLISALVKVQKGQRLALGLDNDFPQNEEPLINIVEGLSEDKI